MIIKYRQKISLYIGIFSFILLSGMNMASSTTVSAAFGPDLGGEYDPAKSAQLICEGKWNNGEALSLSVQMGACKRYEELTGKSIAYPGEVSLWVIVPSASTLTILILIASYYVIRKRNVVSKKK